ncbi:hypothetical protein AB0N05_37615 [Nocardia sp. NPDC051030]|uniref:hypothetical protein n=1 Tax=Nocardia sp. NPDC051030 TaxID=3155162 RepID=UPI00343C7CB9
MERVRLYTRAISFPRLIGRTPDGKKLFGGPYTLTQFIGAGVVGAIMWQTTVLWARGPLVQNAAMFVATVAAVLYGLGKVPAGGRNPLSMLVGFGKAVAAPATTPRVDGRPIRIRRPQALTGRVVILDTPTPVDRSQTPKPVVRAVIRPVPVPVPVSAAAVRLSALAAVSRR